MKLPFLIATIAVLAFIASCSKDKYTTKPQLELNSVNGSEFPNQSLLSFKFTVTDKEGDIQDTMWIQKISYSCSDIGNFLAPYQVPDFTTSKNLKVEMDINYLYGVTSGPYPPIYGCVQRDDSCYFRFWLKDKAGNVSDTVTSPTIKLLKD